MKKFLEKTKGIRTFIGVSIFTISIFIWLVSSLLTSVFYLLEIQTFNKIQSYSFLLLLTFFVYKQLTSKGSRTQAKGLLAKFFNSRPKSEKLEVPKETCQKCGQKKSKKK